MGSDRHDSEEAPIHRATVDGFFIDRMLAIDRELRRFDNATGYATFTEQKPHAKILSDALPHGHGRFARVHAVRTCGGHARLEPVMAVFKFCAGWRRPDAQGDDALSMNKTVEQAMNKISQHVRE